MSQAARPPEAGEFGLAWPGEPTGLAGLAFWLQAGPGTTLLTPDGQEMNAALNLGNGDDGGTASMIASGV